MKLGILGASEIGRLVSETLRHMPGIEMLAVAARDAARARAFAAECGWERAYGSYAELAADPDVELVYITTTINFHAEHIKLCLEAGKHVLCEKAFTTTAAEAREVLALAKRKNLLLAEAIWPRYMPMAKTIRALLDSGRLGNIVSLTANLGYPVWNIERLARPELSGGALLDIGVYPLTFASICFGGDIAEIETSAMLTPEGVDQQSMTQLVYKNGRRAYILATDLTPTDRAGCIYGDAGYAVVQNINNYQRIDVYNDDNELVEQIPAPAQISGYEYQFEASAAAIAAGESELGDMPHSEILAMMELMDSIRHKWGMYYPCEK